MTHDEHPLEWEPHPWQVCQVRGDKHGTPKFIRGPWIEPHVIGDTDGRPIEIRACMVSGWCAAGKCEHCSFAIGLTLPLHSLDDCAEAHHFICRCPCHAEPEPTRPEPQPEQLTLI